MAQSVVCLERSTSLMSGEAEKLQLEAIWPARVLLALDAHFQLSKCHAYKINSIGKNGLHHDKLELHPGRLPLQSTPYPAVCCVHAA